MLYIFLKNVVAELLEQARLEQELSDDCSLRKHNILKVENVFSG